MRLKDFLIEKESFLDKDPEYQIRKVSTKHYQVTSWTRKKDPKNVYDIWDTAKGWTCNCAVRGQCKHIIMCKEWIKSGMPNAWDPKDIGKSFRELIGEEE